MVEKQKLEINTFDRGSIYCFTEFILNGTLVADFNPKKKELWIYSDEKCSLVPCKTLQSAISKVVKFHKKLF
jgi:hypothetical protein